MCEAPAQGSAIADLDNAAAKVVVEAADTAWPDLRVMQLGDTQLYIMCRGKQGFNAWKELGALDVGAQSAALAFIHAITPASGSSSLPELAKVFHCVTLHLP